MTERWQQVLDLLKPKMNEETFEAFMRPMALRKIENGVATLAVPSPFLAEWVQGSYGDVIARALGSADAPMRLTFEIDASLAPPKDLSARETPMPDAPRRRSSRPAARASLPGLGDHGAVPSTPRYPASPTAQPASAAVGTSSFGGTATTAASGASATSATGLGLGHDGAIELNPKYNFDNFVRGPSNQLAHAASQACADDPGKRFNPLFIYGGVGLGKTHLVSAIGHTIQRRNPGARVRYISAERFTNEFIQSLRNNTIEAFRAHYREECDVLLVDDVQFLAAREQTQEAFFHTFNELHHADKQIVLTSDVFPQQIPEMQERLVSRFQSGMVADIQAPELDTRIAILQKKAHVEGLDLGNQVANFIAQVVRSNVRELEGTLIRVALQAELEGRPIDLELAQRCLKAHIPAPDAMTSAEDIQRAVCDYFNIRLSDLKGKKRTRNLTVPRMVAMYLCRERLQESFPAIGTHFNRDHTTVMHGVQKVARLVDEDDDKVVASIAAVERKLGL